MPGIGCHLAVSLLCAEDSCTAAQLTPPEFSLTLTPGSHEKPPKDTKKVLVCNVANVRGGLFEGIWRKTTTTQCWGTFELPDPCDAEEITDTESCLWQDQCLNSLCSLNQVL